MIGRTRLSLVGARVAVLQPLLPQYRVPVFDLLARTTGIELTVICDMHPRGSLKSVPPTEAFRVENAEVREFGPVVSQPAMLSAAMSKRFDAVVLTWNTRILQLVPALFACNATGKGSVLWGHGYSKRDSPIRRAVRRKMMPLADATLVYSWTERARLATAGFNGVFVAPNAIDQGPIEAATKEWKDAPGRLQEWRRLQGIADRKLIVFISRIEQDKRLDLLLEAFHRALRSDPNLTLAIIGGGSGLTAAKAMAEQAGIADRVRFTGPIYDESSIAPWCLSAGCFAYPQAIGLSIQHALGYGLPVITSDDLSAHNPEIEALEPGVNGLLYEHGNPASFAEKMVESIAGHRTRDQWSAAARATVASPNGICLESMVAGFADALSAALARNRQR
jgi:glycosyltransferase involved in cell wall biosynthesis